MTQRGENLAQASFPEMEEAKAALHGLEGLESEPSQAVRAYDGPRDPDALLAHLGYDGFRAGQREPVEAALAGRDSLVVMLTGDSIWLYRVDDGKIEHAEFYGDTATAVKALA